MVRRMWLFGRSCCTISRRAWLGCAPVAVWFDGLTLRPFFFFTSSAGWNELSGGCFFCACAVEQTAMFNLCHHHYLRVDPREYFLRTFSHVLRVVWESPATLCGRLLTLQALCVEVSGPSVQSSVGHLFVGLVVGVSASKVKRRSAPFVRLCSARLPAIGCFGTSCFRRHPSQVISLSWTRSIPQLSRLRMAVCLVVGTSRRRHARID